MPQGRQHGTQHPESCQKSDLLTKENPRDFTPPGQGEKSPFQRRHGGGYVPGSEQPSSNQTSKSGTQ